MTKKTRSDRIKISGINAGVAGEYFVAAELSKRGFIASITLRNTKGIDILASDGKARKTVNIQVKTKQGEGHAWVMGEKAETFHAKDFFYIFVNLRGLHERPDYFIVPSETVATYIRNNHREWLRTPGMYGQKHKDTSMRNFRDPAREYLERWDLLGLRV